MEFASRGCHQNVECLLNKIMKTLNVSRVFFLKSVDKSILSIKLTTEVRET